MDGTTITHEVGHNHAPRARPGCGAATPDPEFPNAEGRIGRIGTGDTTPRGSVMPLLGRPDTLVHPRTPDVMSYCRPRWISAYHFEKALAYRLHTETQAAAFASRCVPAPKASC